MEINEVIKKFKEMYGESNREIRVFASPGRVNLIGEHTDYNGGLVFPAAINMRSLVAVRGREDNFINLSATDLNVTVSADINNLDNYRDLKWGNYQIGVARELQRDGYALVGCDMLFDDTVPLGGGLSSSAAIETAAGLAFSTLADEACGIAREPDMVYLAKVGQRAEHNYVGVKCGIMDQFASAMGRKNHAIYLNCKTLEYKLVKLNLEGYKIVIANTNKKRSLADSKYNERRSECERGLEILKSALPAADCLGDITAEQFEVHKMLIEDEVVRKRVQHVIYEDDRVIKSVTALDRGDICEFARLMTASHNSLRDLYEVTGIELDTLVEAALAQPGCLGSRMTGAGFGGCSVSVVEESRVDDFIAKVSAIYTEKIGYSPTFYVCDISDGGREIKDFDNAPSNFIHNIINEDNKSGFYGGRVHTRFPPEPNGYLHIGHAKAVCINFTTARKYNGLCNLRFDDTNPVKEDEEYVNSIIEDIKWLEFCWEGEARYASDYFDKMYECAVTLIKKGRAFVCDLSAEEIRQYRGTLTEPGKKSPYAGRSVEENLDLFTRMKNGEFADGARVLRANIDMASPNINMRDPVIYRITKSTHHRTGDKWCIYPMYDYAHPIEDAIEGITHSLCSIEFEDHRPLYDWVLTECGFECGPKQIEFARLELTHNVMSKRKLKALVDGGYVDGWDDPRMPTLSGLRRRGYTPSAIRDFCERIGVAKSKSVVDYALLEHCVREDLKLCYPRVMAVAKPVKLVITNYPADKTERVVIENNQENGELGSREVIFSRNLYIDADDFMENPPKKYYRLFPGGEVRLKGAYIIKCDDYKKDEVTGEIIEVYCTYYEDTKSGADLSGKKVKGVIQWVSDECKVAAEFNLYEHLFLDENEEGAQEFEGMYINQKSVERVRGYVEPYALQSGYDRFQFIRNGYFCRDNKSENIAFNRIVSLKSSFKI